MENQKVILPQEYVKLMQSIGNQMPRHWIKNLILAENPNCTREEYQQKYQTISAIKNGKSYRKAITTDYLQKIIEIHKEHTEAKDSLAA